MRTNRISSMKTPSILGISILALLCAAAPAPANITLSTVTIGNSGNAPDTTVMSNGTTGYGQVNYTYAIGKYDVTNTQYTAFLNAVAATDTYALYNTYMANDLQVAGITRSGPSGSYTYAVIAGMGNQPVTYVSWFDAARFSNWLGHGQPVGVQGNGTTETGAYTLNGATSGVGVLNNGSGSYWIPSESEWYKAAYYDPSIAGANKYWTYATRSNSAPGNVVGGAANQANYITANNFYSVTQSSIHSSFQNYLTDVGAFTGSGSAYGTFDQIGDVWNWNDAVLDSLRGLRGGSWANSAFPVQSSAQGFVDPTSENNIMGFRIATPEPTVSVSLMLAGGMLLARRKRPSAL